MHQCIQMTRMREWRVYMVWGTGCAVHHTALGHAVPSRVLPGAHSHSHFPFRRSSTMRYLLFSLMLAACATVPTSSDTTTTVALRVGEEQPVQGAGVSVSFALVDGDSRCPTDVTCVWAGNAVTVLGVRSGSGPTTPYRLNT